MFKILLIFLLPFSLFSFSDNSLEIGISFGGNYIQNETELPVFFEDTCCGNFNNGTGGGFYTGIAVKYELLPSFLFGDIRFLFDSRPADLTVNTNQYKVRDPITKLYKQATIKNDYDATLNYFVFDIGMRIQPVESIPILFRIGYDFSDASITKEYVQTQSIIEPAGLLINGESIETVSKGQINNLTVSQGLSTSIMGNIKLDKIITLSPEISYRYPINSSFDNTDWFTTLIRAGATLYISLNATENKVQNEIVDTIVREQEIIVEKDNTLETHKESINSISINDLHLTETVVTQTYPILPYVFFDSTSSSLNQKYYFNGDVKRFSEQSLDKNSLKIYERLLDIIGSRLTSSKSNLTIKGFTDGREKASLMERNSLALARANTVKNYLVNKWSIKPERFIIEVNDIPFNPTSSIYNEGLSENRRVELVPDDINLLKPIIHSQFLEYASEEEKLVLEIDAEFDDFKDYTIIISDKNSQYYSESKLTKPNKSIEIDLDNKLIKSLAESDYENLNIELLATKNDNRIESKSTELLVIKENNDYELGRLNLIVFDFDKSTISESNKNMIDKFIISNISESSEIEIYGSTDFLGERIYNKELSQKRADNVANYIKTLLPNTKFKTVKGLGSENPKFDNSTPEGRFYCRTVLIEVKTPLKIN